MASWEHPSNDILDDLEKINTYDRNRDAIYCRAWSADYSVWSISAPKYEAIDFAITKLPEVYGEFLSTIDGWREPHVTATPDGDVHIMWHNGEKIISLYFSGNDIQYIKSWGADIKNQIEEGNANTLEDRVRLWLWFVNGKKD